MKLLRGKRGGDKTTPKDGMNIEVVADHFSEFMIERIVEDVISVVQLSFPEMDREYIQLRFKKDTMRTRVKHSVKAFRRKVKI